jgi:hypothetical protein
MDKKVEVINLSVSGYSTAEQVIALQQEGVKYSPDLIVSTWHHTDLDENRWSNLFSIENGQLKRKADSYLPGVRERAILESIPLYSFLSEQSQGYSFVREKAALIIKSIMRNKKSTTVDSPPNAEKSDLAVALYTKLANVARQSNAPLVVLNIPKKTSSQIYENTMPSGIRENFFVAEPIRLFKENRASLLYWEHSQGHFTPLGNDLVAQTLALKIMDMTQSKNNNR